MPELDRFRRAQEAPGSGFDAALREIRFGRKRGHWIWYIFPQLAGLGFSAMSQAFAIADRQEAIDYLRDPVLRDRLLTITRAVAEQLDAGTPLARVMGSGIDAKKLVSSLTLFGAVARDLLRNDPDADKTLQQLAAVADDVLARAEAQGYPPCEYTRRALGSEGQTS